MHESLAITWIEANKPKKELRTIMAGHTKVMRIAGTLAGIHAALSAKVDDALKGKYGK